MNEAPEEETITAGIAETDPWRRKTFSLPTSLAEWVEHKAQGNASAYVASLIEADRHRELAREELRAFGYTGPREITDEGRARARARLDAHAASRATRDRRRAA
jgi:hypothetical protein